MLVDVLLPTETFQLGTSCAKKKRQEEITSLVLIIYVLLLSLFNYSFIFATKKNFINDSKTLNKLYDLRQTLQFHITTRATTHFIL